MVLIQEMRFTLNFIGFGQDAYKKQIQGFLGVHAIKLLIPAVAINPLAAASAYSISRIVQNVAYKFFSTVSTISNSDLRRACLFAAEVTGIVAGFAAYTSISTLTTTHLVGINALLFFTNFAVS